jgi:hypothetical protein
LSDVRLEGVSGPDGCGDKSQSWSVRQSRTRAGARSDPARTPRAASARLRRYSFVPASPTPAMIPHASSGQYSGRAEILLARSGANSKRSIVTSGIRRLPPVVEGRRRHHERIAHPLLNTVPPDCGRASGRNHPARWGSATDCFQENLQVPPGRSVRPIDPANTVSPVKSVAADQKQPRPASAREFPELPETDRQPAESYPARYRREPRAALRGRARSTLLPSVAWLRVVGGPQRAGRRVPR